MNIQQKRFYTTREAAVYLSLGVNTLEIARVRGTVSKHHNLPYVKLGHSVRYDVADLDAYAAARRVNSTSERAIA